MSLRRKKKKKLKKMMMIATRREADANKTLEKIRSKQKSMKME